MGGWKDDTFALAEDLDLGFQHPHDGSQLSITPVPEDPAPSSDLYRHNPCGTYIEMQAKCSYL